MLYIYNQAPLRTSIMEIFPEKVNEISTDNGLNIYQLSLVMNFILLLFRLMIKYFFG